MQVLVTGAAGFIGRYVCDLLTRHGHAWVGIDSYEHQVHGNHPDYMPEERVFRSSLQNACVQKATDLWAVDAVIHLASAVGVAQSNDEIARYVQRNVLDTALLWERIRDNPRIKKVVVASSMSIYGEGSYLADAGTGLHRPHYVRRHDPRPDHWDSFCLTEGNVSNYVDYLLPTLTHESIVPDPASVYALTKYDQERYSLMLGEMYGRETVALRFFNTYGPKQSIGNPYTGVLAQFMNRALNGADLIVNEDGRQTRDFIYVEDVARAVVQAATVNAGSGNIPAGVYNVCTGERTSIIGLAGMFADIVQPRLPRPNVVVSQNYRAGDVRHCVGDNTRLRAYGWEPRVSLLEGVDRTAEWMQRQQPAPDLTDKANAELLRYGKSLLRVNS